MILESFLHGSCQSLPCVSANEGVLSLVDFKIQNNSSLSCKNKPLIQLDLASQEQIDGLDIDR